MTETFMDSPICLRWSADYLNGRGPSMDCGYFPTHTPASLGCVAFSMAPTTFYSMLFTIFAGAHDA